MLLRRLFNILNFQWQDVYFYMHEQICFFEIGPIFMVHPKIVIFENN